MKNNLVCKKIINIILIIMFILTTKTYAANDSFNTTIRANNDRTKRGDTITVTIGLKNIEIESGEKGIGGYTASIKFDSSVLEYISSTGTDKWEAPFYQNGLITGNTKDAEVVKTTQDIGTITFKVKDDAKLGETIISLTDFSGTTAVTDVSASDVSTKITVVDDNNGNNNNSNSNSNNNNSNNNSSNSNKISNTNAVDNTVVSGKLPQTGEGNIGLIVCIGLIMACSVICYVKMKKK